MADSTHATSSVHPAAPDRPQVDPQAMSIDQVAKVLSAGGGRKVMVKRIEADIAAGAPVGRDGRMNLVAYAAWLSRENQRAVSNGGVLSNGEDR